MNSLTLILLIISVFIILAGLIWLIHFIRIKRQKAAFPITINYVRREISSKGQSLYLELELKNKSGKSIFVSEVQQRNMKGPLETFLLQDAQGKTKRSLFEIREHFPNKKEIKDGVNLYRYYKMKLNPSMMDMKLFFQYRAIGSAGVVSNSNAL